MVVKTGWDRSQPALWRFTQMPDLDEPQPVIFSGRMNRNRRQIGRRGRGSQEERSSNKVLTLQNPIFLAHSVVQHIQGLKGHWDNIKKAVMQGKQHKLQPLLACWNSILLLQLISVFLQIPDNDTFKKYNISDNEWQTIEDLEVILTLSKNHPHVKPLMKPSLKWVYRYYGHILLQWSQAKVIEVAKALMKAAEFTLTHHNPADKVLRPDGDHKSSKASGGRPSKGESNNGRVKDHTEKDLEQWDCYSSDTNEDKSGVLLLLLGVYIGFWESSTYGSTGTREWKRIEGNRRETEWGRIRRSGVWVEPCDAVEGRMKKGQKALWLNMTSMTWKLDGLPA
ncbi:hypothetical protein EDB84DRAFT_1436386 [Lactarius hengduanensis]|nr:hypothetical protein EDB84DRAFT_1436386 [Lactarius hengduanensis]